MPGLLDLAASAAKHAAARQAVIARNVANADTPGYRALDVAPFSPGGSDLAMRRTHPAHFGAEADRRARSDLVSGTADPNGNSVNLEDQVLRGVEAQRAHGRAVTIYSSTLDLLRAGLGRR
jgi:flagellar basal-body rod protein FlgB